MADEDITTGKILIIEYERLKEEQKVRISFRDSLIYATLAVLAAVIAATLQSSPRSDLLLLIPPTSILLGWTYLVNDQKASAIGRYILEHIAPRVAALPSVDSPVFGWEQSHRADIRRKSRKRLQLMADLGIFCLAPLVAVVTFWINDDAAPLLIVVSIFEAIIVGVLAVQFFLYADFG